VSKAIYTLSKPVYRLSKAGCAVSKAISLLSNASCSLSKPVGAVSKAFFAVSTPKRAVSSAGLPAVQGDSRAVQNRRSRYVGMIFQNVSRQGRKDRQEIFYRK
jgi:D-serine deaminase-like pyridoxal phosphate-dependent protein